MGNFLSLYDDKYSCTIENIHEHATNLMTSLDQLRQERLHCDVVFADKDLTPAHSIVLSFNRVLFDVANASSKTIALDIDEENNSPDFNAIITRNVESKEEAKSPQQLQTDFPAEIAPKEEKNECYEENNEDIDFETNLKKNNSKFLNVEDTEQQSNEKSSLRTEIAFDDVELNEKQTSIESVNESSNTADPWLINPIQVLISFLYTSNIDVTQKNVCGLQALATQCGLEGVARACAEFGNVLRIETESLATENDKSAVATQFRYRYSDPSLPSKLLHHFHALLQENKHTDVTVLSPSGNVRVNAHSVILVAGSSFFQPIISTQKQQQDLEVTEIDESVLETLIQFIYTGKVNVTPQNVSKLIQASDRMQLNDVIKGCAEYLELTINVNNCIQHRSIGIDYKCDKLVDFANKFIVENFQRVAHTPDFMTLSVGGLLDITTSNELYLDYPVADGEMAVFNTIKLWLLHDEINRMQHLTEVMSAVRFPLIRERHLLDDITTDLLVMENQDMCDLITSVISSKPSMCFANEVTMRGPSLILTIGGSFPIDDETSDDQGYQAVAYSDHCTLYDQTDGSFLELTKLPETRALHGVVSCDQFVFVVGGFDSYSCIVNTVYCLDLSDLTWHTMPSLRIKRSCFSLHVIAGYIFAVGGLTPSGYTATVERLDRKKKVWEMAKPLPRTTYRHAGCVWKNEILITGGYEKQDSAFSYNPDIDCWRKCQSMNRGRDSHVLEAIEEKAYAIGGEGINFSGESYDGNVWTMLCMPSKWPSKLFLPGSAVIDDKLYLIGGWERENEIHYNIRYYDSKLCEWSTTDHRMPIPKGSASSCQVFFLKQSNQYSKF